MRLHLTFSQGRSFECLLQLQNLRIEADLPGCDDESIRVDLAGLPLGLKTFEVESTLTRVDAVAL